VTNTVINYKLTSHVIKKRTTIRARLSQLDKDIDTSAKFYAYITEKSYIKNVMNFLTGGAYKGAYAPYATCMATPLR